MNPKEFLQPLCGKSLTDLQVVGVVCPTHQGHHFTPFFEQVFWVLCSGLIELSTFEQGESLRLRWINAILPACNHDPEAPLATSSIAPVILRDVHADSPIQSIKVFNARIESDGLHCEALQLLLQNRQVLFFDPTYTFGIRIGGSEQEGIWRENRFHLGAENPLVVGL